MPKLQIEDEIAVIVHKLIVSSDTDVDDKVVARIKAALDGIDLSTEPTDADVSDALFGILQEVTALTKTEWDDRALKITKLAWESFGGDTLLGRLFSKF